MTREEAKYRLEIALKCIGCEWHCYDENNVVTCEYYEDKCRLDLREAIQTAISNGLSQEPKTQMIDKSNFDIEQYKMDLQCAYDCGFGAGKKAEQEPCTDAVSREALKKMLIGLDKWHVKNKQFVNVGLLYDDVFLGIEQLPSVTHKSGKWIKDECGNVICSECKRFRRDCRYGHTNYCNHCGARMVEPQESEV